MPQRKVDKIGRNDPCPCGSGEKYKNCCLGRERRGGTSFVTKFAVLRQADPDDLPTDADIWTSVEMALPFSVPGLSGKEFAVKTGDIEGRVKMVDAFRPPGYLNAIFGLEMTGSATGWFTEDPYGYATYSKAEVLVHDQLVLPESAAWHERRMAMAQASEKQALDELTRVEARELGKALVPVNLLVEHHALVTRQFWTRYVKPRHIGPYSYAYRVGPAGADRQKTHVALPGSYELHAGDPRPPLPRRQISEIRRVAASGPMSTERRLVVSARRMLSEGDARLAVIDLAIALEAGVGRYLRDFFLGAGIGSDEFEDLVREVGISRALKVLLPLACPVQLPADVLNDCKGMLTIRNKIMHEARAQVEEADARKFSEAVERLLDHLDGNPVRQV